VIADESLSSTKFTYASVEGNFITGLEIKDLAFDKKTLVKSATLHWNPISLIYKKISLTQVDAKGVDIHNIMSMIDGFEKKSKSSSELSLPLSISMQNIHLDINPYTYAGMRLDSFVFETKRIDLDKDLLVDAENLYLYFNSDIVNVELHGNIDKSRIFLSRLSLKEIGTREIAGFVREIAKLKKSQNSKISDSNSSKSIKKSKDHFFKEIKIDHIYATMKDVTYGPFSMNGIKLNIYDTKVDPYHNYSYKAKKVDFKGDTTFGSVHYKGYIKDSNTYAKGKLLLSKKLFSMYHLPLNYKALKELSGSLHLNHFGVWLDIEHDVKELLTLKTDFNIDLKKAKHSLAYVYKDKKVIIKSEAKADMSYGDNVTIENKVLVDIAKKGYTVYSGKVTVPKVKNLPSELTDYLIKDLTAVYKGDKSGFEVRLDSKFLDGTFITNGYKSAILKLKSKERNISLKKLLPFTPKEFSSEKIALKSKSFFDFRKLSNSNITLNVVSDIVNIDTTMKLRKPYRILFQVNIPDYSILANLESHINLEQIKNISGDLLIEDGVYSVNIKDNKELDLFFKYISKTKQIRNGKVLFGGEEIKFFTSSSGNLEIKLNVNNIGTLLQSIEKYYEITLPHLKGSMNLEVIRDKRGLLKFFVKSPLLTYISDSKLAIEKIDLEFTFDTNGDIVVDKYRFRIDNNPYFKDYYAHKPSYLNFKNGRVKVKKFWLNNRVEIDGSYMLETANGNFKFLAKEFPFISKDFDLLFDANGMVSITGNKIAVDGDLSILGNTVTYDMGSSTIVEDPDIIIVQEEEKKRDSALNNLKLYLNIKSEKPLMYYGKDTNIEFYNELRVMKEYNTDFMLTGMSTVTKGYYELEDKRFTLNESHIYFAGDPKKPLLDIKANYVKDEYTIHIFISGSVDEPIVNFNSDPYLTQQEILSLILFDGTGSSSGEGAEAYTLLGGAFAKGLIRSLGIDVDHLLLGTNADDELSLEVGRKISDDITFMYMYKNGENGAKVRVEHSKKFETDIIIMPSASSIEFLYRKDR
jgi:translocation and assembly module TamB